MPRISVPGTGAVLDRTVREALDGLEEGRDYVWRHLHGERRICLTASGASALFSHLGIEVVADDPLRELTGALGGASLTGGPAPAYGAGELSSVTLVRNAKGGVQPEVKVYAANPAEAQQRAVEIFDALAAKYPHVTAGAAGEKKE